MKNRPNHWGLLTTILLIMAVSIFVHVTTNQEFQAIKSASQQLQEQVKDLYEVIDGK